MKLSKGTFEDLIGNIADDAKQALDEVLERDDESKAKKAAKKEAKEVRKSAVGEGPSAPSSKTPTPAVEGVADLSGQLADLKGILAGVIPALKESAAKAAAEPVAAGAIKKA